MNREELINLGLTMRSWKPEDTTGSFRQDCATLLQRALDRLAGDCPSALVPDDEIVVFPKDYNSSGSEVHLSVTSDAWVLRFTPDVSTLLDRADPYPPVNETLDGLYWVEFQTQDGEWHRRVSRTFWRVENLSGTYTYYVSLDKPFHGSDTSMPFRLYAPEVFLRDNHIRLLDGMLLTSSREQLVLRSDSLKNKYPHADINGLTNGRPRALLRGRHFQLPAPSYTPLIEDADPDTWVGQEPGGTFKYRYTYVHGKRDAEYRTPGNFYEAQFESSPSPASATATVEGVGANAVNVRLPNVDFMQGFDNPGDLRRNMTGWKKRIYRARLSTLSGGVEYVEANSVYYLIAEVAGDVTTWQDDGSVTPDFFRRIPEVVGYYAYTTMPHQDIRYEAELRVLHRPKPLLADTDAPPIEPQAQEALVQLFLHYLAHMDKQLEEAEYHRQQYQNEIKTLAALQAQRASVLPTRAFGDTRIRKGYGQIPLGAFRNE